MKKSITKSKIYLQYWILTGTELQENMTKNSMPTYQRRVIIAFKIWLYLVIFSAPYSHWLDTILSFDKG